MLSIITVVEASKHRHHAAEEQENKLVASHRTISLPTGINHKDGGGAKQKQTNFYVNTPPTTPVGKLQPSTSHDYSGI